MSITSLRHKLHTLEARDREVAAAYDASGATVLAGRKAMAAAIHKALLRIKEADKKALVTLDGLPGTAKTAITKRVKDRGHNIGVIPGDRFLVTKCGSPEWQHVVQNAESFNTNWLKEDDAKSVVAEGLSALQSGKGVAIPIVDYAVRDFPKKLDLPSNADAIFYEGLGANRITSQVEVPDGVVRIDGLTRTTVLESLFGSTLRDVLDRIDPAKFVERYMYRLKEAPYLLEWVAEAVKRATHICLRYKKPNSFSKRVERKLDQPIRNTGMTVRDLLTDLDPEFLEATFPGPLPGQQDAEPQPRLVKVA